jgi:predicted transcriptional regulator
MDTAANVKLEAKRLVDRLPDGATWEDLMYEIYVRQSVEAGMADVDAGRVIPHEEVRGRLNLPPR